MASEEELAEKYGARVSSEPAPLPDKNVTMKGTYVTIVCFTQDHFSSLWNHVKADPKLMEYMPTDKPTVASEQDLRDELTELLGKDDPICYAVLADPRHLNPGPHGRDAAAVGPHDEVVGVAFYGNIFPKQRAIEVGAMFSPTMQRTAASTEVHQLLFQAVFEADSPVLGGSIDARVSTYRRCCWKCNRLNKRSRNSALRVGYSHEGTHRQAQIVHGRTRDDDWFGIIDSEWPVAKAALEKWFQADNWDENGQQVKKLQQIRSELAQTTA